jgi:hypothetical protein
MAYERHPFYAVTASSPQPHTAWFSRYRADKPYPPQRASCLGTQEIVQRTRGAFLVTLTSEYVITLCPAAPDRKVCERLFDPRALEGRDSGAPVAFWRGRVPASGASGWRAPGASWRGSGAPGASWRGSDSDGVGDGEGDGERSARLEPCKQAHGPAPTPDETADPQDAVAFWDQANREDWQACGRTQQGVAARAYVPGPACGEFEKLVVAFDQEILKALGR